MVQKCQNNVGVGGDLEVGEEEEKFGNRLSRTNDNDLARPYNLTFSHHWMTLHRSCDLLFPSLNPLG